MIAACPKCRTRYRLRSEQLATGAVRLQCRRCGGTFRVLAPARSNARELGTTTPPAAPVPTSGVTAAAGRCARSRRILIAHGDAPTARSWSDTLTGLGCETRICRDGIEALLTLRRNPPRAAVLAAALPRVGGYELCELVKRDECLRGTGVIVVTEAGARDADAAQGCGPDATLESSAVPRALGGALRALGLPLPNEVPIRAAEASAPAAAPEDAGRGPARPLAAGRVLAERLARVAVSDIVLYNEEKFARARREGTVLETMREELEEGRALLRSRIDARVLAERDFVADELLRAATPS